MDIFSDLRRHYSRFLEAHPGRILLTGHSHQAWPDVSRDAQIKAWDDAAEHADGKWDLLFGSIVPAFQRHIAARIGEPDPANISIGQNTLEFLFRILSCFPIGRAMRIVSTNSEFHSLNRLLLRLEEEDVQAVRVDTADKETLADRIVEAILPGTTIVALSQVFFDTSFLLQDAARIARRAEECGAVMIFDAYHAFNVVPFSVNETGLQAYYLGGGYKYTQSGEGAAWMRLPAGASLRPIYTGWFADFGALDRERKGAGVQYAGGGFRFAGATFDPTPFYRANASFDLMDSLGLTPDLLRARSLHLTGRIIGLYDGMKLVSKGLGLATPRDPAHRGGFISFEHPDAQTLCAKLREKDIWTDSRGRFLRLGPAPYATEEEILTAMRAIAALLS